MTHVFRVQNVYGKSGKPETLDNLENSWKHRGKLFYNSLNSFEFFLDFYFWPIFDIRLVKVKSFLYVTYDNSCQQNDFFYKILKVVYKFVINPF